MSITPIKTHTVREQDVINTALKHLCDVKKLLDYVQSQDFLKLPQEDRRQVAGHLQGKCLESGITVSHFKHF